MSALPFTPSEPPTGALVPVPQICPAVMVDLAERAATYAEAAKSDNTRRAYRTDFQQFSDWCAEHGLAAMPASASTVLAFLVAHAGKVKVSTLQRRLAAIRETHRYSGAELDTSAVAFRDAWRGIRRAHATPPDKRAPLVTVGLRQALAALPDNLLGTRDRALLLIGFAAALRRSELVGLQSIPADGATGWIETTADGLTIHLARSKTNQEGADEMIGVPYGSARETCPVRSYAAWIAAAGIASGPAFRAIDRHGNLGSDALSDKAVARIVKRSLLAAALAEGMTMDAARVYVAKFSGHSLRRGLATSAAAGDAPPLAIQRQLRHRKADTTNGYIEAGRLFRQNAAGFAGL
jgi:integrase